MNSRERVIKTLNHKEPDKVPIDFGGTLASLITRDANDALRKYLALPAENPEVAEIMCNTIRMREDILLHYQVDTRPIYISDPATVCFDIKSTNTFEDGYGVEWQKASYYYDAISRPFKAGTIDELKNAKWEDLSDKTIVRGLRDKAKLLFESTDYCLVADMPCLGPFEGGCILRGYDNFLTDLYYNKKFAQALLDKITETALVKWDMILSEVGEFIQVAAYGDDIGMQQSTYISPEMYRKFIKPLHYKIFDLIHSKTKAKVFLHTCGSVYDIIPDFIEIGLDILNPIQRFAAKMDIKNLKNEFGKDLCFWGGGIDIQKQLPFLNKDEIRKEIDNTLSILAPGGGYVFAFTHNIQPDVPPEKVDFSLRTFLELRKY